MRRNLACLECDRSLGSAAEVCHQQAPQRLIASPCSGRIPVRCILTLQASRPVDPCSRATLPLGQAYGPTVVGQKQLSRSVCLAAGPLTLQDEMQAHTAASSTLHLHAGPLTHLACGHAGLILILPGLAVSAQQGCAGAGHIRGGATVAGAAGDAAGGARKGAGSALFAEARPRGLRIPSRRAGLRVSRQ